MSITPSANATGVVRSTAITAVFSSTLDCATVSASSVTVTDAGGVAVAGTISCSGTDAGFTPAAKLTGETVYTVTVSGTVKNIAGNELSGDYTWSFTTKARGWGTASAVDSSLTASQFGRDSLGDSTEAKIAMAANGKAVAIWRFKKDASNFSHYYSIGAAHFDGSTWSAGDPPLYWTVVSGETVTGYQSDTQGPNVTIDSSGRETLVWYKASDSTNYGIYSKNYTPVDGWTNYTTMGTTTYAYPGPKVVADDAGAVTAVWGILDGSRYIMWSKQND